MKLKLDTKSQPNWPVKPIVEALGLTMAKIKAWWKRLPEDKKEKVCSICISTIISDLANAANNAYVVCKLNPTFTKKDLVRCITSKSVEGAIKSQTFEFNFSGKDILDKDLAELFSCFYILIPRNTSQENSRQEKSSQSSSHSHVGVKKEKLGSLLDLLSKSLFQFSEGNKSLFQKDDLGELYLFFVKEFPQNINSVITLHPYVQNLFDKLAAISFILEYQIYLAYFDESSLYQDQEIHKKDNTVGQTLAEKINNLSCLLDNNTKKIAPLLVKTVSQVEKECHIQDRNRDQSSTASDSPKNLIVRNSNQSVDYEELSQKLSEKSSKEQTKDSTPLRLNPSTSKDQNKYLAPEEIKSSHPHYTSAPYYPTLEIYEGFFIGDLEIPFDPTDVLMMNDEDDICQNEKSMSCYEQDSQIERADSQEEGEYRDEEEKAGYQNYYDGNNYSNSDNIYYMQPIMDNIQAYHGPQILYGPEFYGTYNNFQQTNSGLISNYAFPMVQMSPIPAEVGYYPDYYQNDVISDFDNRDNYHNRKVSFESYSSYGSNRDYEQSHNPGLYYQNEYERQPFRTPDREQQYFFREEKPKYNTKPKLPPRLQKKKEKMFRN